jgi:hypothetical protein
MNSEGLYLAAVGLLYGLGALCMKNTHPYSGSRKEKFESKQERRLIGTILLVTATLLLGVALLTQYLMSKN